MHWAVYNCDCFLLLKMKNLLFSAPVGPFDGWKHAERICFVAVISSKIDLADLRLSLLSFLLWLGGQKRLNLTPLTRLLGDRSQHVFMLYRLDGYFCDTFARFPILSSTSLCNCRISRAFKSHLCARYRRSFIFISFCFLSRLTSLLQLRDLLPYDFFSN